MRGRWPMRFEAMGARAARWIASPHPLGCTPIHPERMDAKLEGRVPAPLETPAGYCVASVGSLPAGAPASSPNTCLLAE